ncbi:hypothetical protein ONZ45_g15641 [Pleurotus djamor]|nr:hypothetical protein ONZ45_g15641 [Pleurotus djamor]
MPNDPPVQYSKKRLIVCCDGTGQADSHGSQVIPSNVARFARALQVSEKLPPSKEDNRPYNEEIQQVVLYQTGVGTDSTASVSGTVSGKTAGTWYLEMFGHGVDNHVLEAYYFFVNNYEPEDEIYIFGFSRGAFTARAISSFICHAGLLQKKYADHLPVIFEAYKARQPDSDPKNEWKALEQSPDLHTKIHPPGLTISILGVWDTVGSIGIPETWASSYLGWTGVRDGWNKQHDHHDMGIVRTPKRGHKFTLPYVKAAFQALALDEHRMSFSPTLFFDPTPTAEPPADNTQLQQCWFPGVHSDVGGSYARGYLDISDLALAWMIDRCSPQLAFDRKALHEWIQEPSSKFERGAVDFKKTEIYDTKANPSRWGLSKLNDSFVGHWKVAGSRVRTPGQYFLKEHHDKNKKLSYGTNEFIHPSVRVRLMQNKNLANSKDHYLPPSLKGFVLKRYHDQAGDGWKWVKEVEVDGQKHTVELREYKIYRGRGYFEEEMLTEEAKEWIDDPQADEDVNLVADDEPKTWGQTLRSWMPF